MTTSTGIAAGTLPSSDQLWLFGELFRNDWTEGMSVSREYKTNVEFGISAAEQRYGLASRPVHSMSVLLQAGGRDNLGSLQTISSSARREIGSIISLARRQTMAKALWPLFSDEVRSTAAWASGSDTITVEDTTLRRITVGKRVVVIPPDMPNRQDGPYYPDTYPLVIATVTAVSTNLIELDVAAAQNWPAGARIYPLFEARLQFQLQGEITTDSYASLSITVIEEEGPTQIPGRVPVGDLPAGATVKDGLPVLDPDYDYSGITWGFSRRGQRSNEGISGSTVAYGSRGMFTMSYPIVATSRAEAFKEIEFFDSRGGKLHPFWLIPPTSDYYDFLGTFAGGTQIILKSGGSPLDFDFRPYVYIRESGGTLHIREIDNALRASEDTYLLTLTESIPTLAAGAASVGVVYKARFDIDEMTEEWITDEVMQTTLRIIEVEEEKSITITDIDEVITSSLLVEATQGSCSGEATILLVPCGACGSQMTVCTDDILPGDVIKAAAAQWQPSTAYAKGAHVLRVGGTDQFETWKALNSGTSGGSEPDWPEACPVEGSPTVFDGGIEWERTSRCYFALSIPTQCQWPTPVGYSLLTDCDECLDAFPCPEGLPLCCLGGIGAVTFFTRECFCKQRPGNPVDICCTCTQTEDPGCEVDGGDSIECGGAVGSYTITAAEKAPCSSSCCTDGPDNQSCCLFKMTRVG